MKITTQKIGSIWHGYLEGHPEVDERGLTEEKVREKVREYARRGDENTQTPRLGFGKDKAGGEP